MTIPTNLDTSNWMRWASHSVLNTVSNSSISFDPGEQKTYYKDHNSVNIVDPMNDTDGAWFFNFRDNYCNDPQP